MRRKLSVLAASGLLCAVMAACSEEDDSRDAAGPADAPKPLSGAEFTVGSKEFTEQLILGQITLKVLEAAGAEVDDKTGLSGSVVTRQALLSGELDMYWEYTGTAWITYLKHTKPIPDAQAQYEAVAKEDMRENQIAWLPPAPLDNTYALAVSPETSDSLGVRTISDLADVANTNPDQVTMCVSEEFKSRDDGLPGLEQHYDFAVPPSQVAKLETGIIYTRVQEGDPCAVGEVLSTDGRIEKLGLILLEDDRGFFPKYNASLNINADVLKKYPQLEELFAPVAAKLTSPVMQTLNGKVDIDGELPEEVAQQWLEDNGLLG